MVYSYYTGFVFCLVSLITYLSFYLAPLTWALAPFVPFAGFQGLIPFTFFTGILYDFIGSVPYPSIPGLLANVLETWAIPILILAVFIQYRFMRRLRVAFVKGGGSLGLASYHHLVFGVGSLLSFAYSSMVDTTYGPSNQYALLVFGFFALTYNLLAFLAFREWKKRFKSTINSVT